MSAIPETGPAGIHLQLERPIPLMHELRARKSNGYDAVPIATRDPRFYEPVIEVRRTGVAGQSYYSRPNATVADALPGVPVYPELRQTVAETLGRLNGLMRSLAVTAFFGAEVELYVEEGLRTRAVQGRLHDREVPALIRRNDPNLSDEEVASRRDEIIAAPSWDPLHPSPHATGGAVDVILRYRQKTPLFVPGASVWLGHRDGDTGRTIDPDFFETHDPRDERDELARRNRRAFYAIMTGAAFGIYTGMVVNPTEIWHWSRGDQLWAQTTGATAAYYGPVRD